MKENLLKGEISPNGIFVATQHHAFFTKENMRGKRIRSQREFQGNTSNFLILLQKDFFTSKAVSF